MNNLKSWLADEIKQAARPLPELLRGQGWRIHWEMHGGTLTEYRDWLAYQSVWVCERSGYLNPLVAAIFESIIKTHGERFYDALRAIGVPRSALVERCGSINHQAAQRLDDILGAVKLPDQNTKRTIFDCLVQILTPTAGAKRGGYAKTNLTELQTEAMHQLGIHKTKAAAARAMGISRGSFDKHHRAACKKLGIQAVKKSPRTEQYHNDHRGQAALTHDHRQD